MCVCLREWVNVFVRVMHVDKAWICSAEELLELHGKVEGVVNNCLLRWSGHLVEVAGTPIFDQYFCFKHISHICAPIGLFYHWFLYTDPYWILHAFLRISVIELIIRNMPNASLVLNGENRGIVAEFQNNLVICMCVWQKRPPKKYGAEVKHLKELLVTSSVNLCPTLWSQSKIPCTARKLFVRAQTHTHTHTHTNINTHTPRPIL